MASEDVGEMEIRSGRLATTQRNAHDDDRKAAAPLLTVVAASNPVPSADAASRAVSNVLLQVVDLLSSVAGGIQANRASHKPSIADTRLVEGANAVLTDLVEHTRIGEEQPLLREVKPKLGYGNSLPSTASRAWIGEARATISGLQRYLAKVADRGVSQDDVMTIGDWRTKVSDLAQANQTGVPLDLSA